MQVAAMQARNREVLAAAYLIIGPFRLALADESLPRTAADASGAMKSQ